MPSQKVKQAIVAALLAGVTLTGPSVAGGRDEARIVGSRHTKTEVRTVRGFDAVELFGVGEVSLVQGDRETLTIEAEDNVLPYIVSRVQRGKLRLGIERSNVETRRPIRFRLSVRGLKRLETSGAGSIQAGPISSDNFDLDVSGAGNVRIERLNTRRLRVSLSGAGGAKVAGLAERQEVDISGAGSYDGKRFLTRDTDVSLSGAGQARVHASGKLKADVSGAGSVRYSGSPTQTDFDVSGAGGIERD